MIVAIGAFDGFHLGHRALLGMARDFAAKNNTNWGILTFSPHPGVYFDKMRKLLFSDYEKAALGSFLDIPNVITVRFDDALRGMSPEKFFDHICSEFSVSGIVIGEDFRFSDNAAGDAPLVRRICDKRGMPCSIVKPVDYIRGIGGARKLSTTLIRTWVENSDMEKVRRYLGFPFPIEGEVVHGKNRGAGLGAPTANIAVGGRKLLPKEGSYAASVLVNGMWKAGALFIGKPPSFIDVNESNVEVHIVDFSESLYGKKITVFVEEFLHAPQKFDNKFELVKSIRQSVINASAIFQKNHADSQFIYQELARAFSAPVEADIKGAQTLGQNSYKKSYITLDGSNITEIFHPSFEVDLNCSLAEAVVRPGECTTKHIHTESTEIYYGLDGAGMMYIEGDTPEKIPFTAGCAVLIRPGTPHYICANDAKMPLRFLCYCSPAYTHEQTKTIPKEGLSNAKT